MVIFIPYCVTGQFLIVLCLSMEATDQLFLESSGTIPFFASELRPALSDETRAKRNEKRRLRYASKHSKKAKHTKLCAEKDQLEKEVQKLRKLLKEKMPSAKPSAKKRSRK